MTDTFKVGDEAEWTSQAGGHTKTKQGKVVAVVPVLVRPFTVARKHLEGRYNLHDIDGGLGMRRHESYLIDVKGRLYWPRVSALQRARTE